MTSETAQNTAGIKPKQRKCSKCKKEYTCRACDKTVVPPPCDLLSDHSAAKRKLCYTCYQRAQGSTDNYWHAVKARQRELKSQGIWKEWDYYHYNQVEVYDHVGKQCPECDTSTAKWHYCWKHTRMANTVDPPKLCTCKRVCKKGYKCRKCGVEVKPLEGQESHDDRSVTWCKKCHEEYEQNEYTKDKECLLRRKREREEREQREKAQLEAYIKIHGHPPPPPPPHPGPYFVEHIHGQLHTIWGI
jgi:hypothetical protein